MKVNQVKEKLRRGEAVFGTMLRELTSPEVCEILAQAGLDFLILDAEHSVYSYETIQSMAASSKQSGIACFARVADAAYHLIARILDAGVEGVMVPRVETKQTVEEVIAAAKYPPSGRRGWGLRRIHLGGAPASIAESIAHFNENTLVIIQVESRRALDNLEEMLGVPGVDVALVGPADLSISLGCPGQFESPQMEEALQHVIAVCKKKGVASSVHFPSAQLWRKWFARGMRFVLCSNEWAIFSNGAREFTAGLKSELQEGIEK